LNAPQETNQSCTYQGVCWRNVLERPLGDYLKQKNAQASLDTQIKAPLIKEFAGATSLNGRFERTKA
jgi:hypothetical protein